MTLKIDRKERPKGLGPAELARILGVSKGTLLRWEDEGLKPPEQTGFIRKTRTYHEPELINVLEFMQKIKRGNPTYPGKLVPSYPWLQSVDLKSRNLKLETPVPYIVEITEPY